MGYLTPVQSRTVRDLIGSGRAPADGGGLSERCRERLEDELRRLDLDALGRQLWLGKGALTDLERCDGMFDARRLGEMGPFEHSERTAAGALFHKAIEVDVGSGQGFDPREVAERAGLRLAADDRAFARHWDVLAQFDRSALEASAARCVTLFRASFPPLGPGTGLAPLPELPLRAEVAGGRVVLTGKLDLLIVVREPGDARGCARLVLDLKTGAPRPEHAEDMRLYALLVALRFGEPPYRVATFFLESGEWQPEDVTEDTLGRAVDRVVAAARAAVDLAGGRDPVYRVGPYCDWCPRRPSCPEHAPLGSSGEPEAVAGPG